MPLKQGKRVFQINVTKLEIPTDMTEDLSSGIPLMAGWRLSVTSSKVIFVQKPLLVCFLSDVLPSWGWGLFTGRLIFE